MKKAYCDLCTRPIENNMGSALQLLTTSTLPNWTAVEHNPSDLCAECGHALHLEVERLKKLGPQAHAGGPSSKRRAVPAESQGSVPEHVPVGGGDLTRLRIVLSVLNSAYEADPDAVHALICCRVPCNKALAGHSSVPVSVNQVTPLELPTIDVLSLLSAVSLVLTGYGLALSWSPDNGDGTRKLLGFRMGGTGPCGS